MCKYRVYIKFYTLYACKYLLGVCICLFFPCHYDLHVYGLKRKTETKCFSSSMVTCNKEVEFEFAAIDIASVHLMIPAVNCTFDIVVVVFTQWYQQSTVPSISWSLFSLNRMKTVRPSVCLNVRRHITRLCLFLRKSAVILDFVMVVFDS